MPAAGAAVAQLPHSLLLRCHCWRCSPRSCVRLPAPSLPAPTSPGPLPPRRHADCSDRAPCRHWPVLRVLLVLYGLHFWWVRALHLRGRCCAGGCVAQWHAAGALPLLLCYCFLRLLHNAPAPTPAICRTDTTLGLLLTIGLHKAALRGAAWYGRRAAERLGSEELQPAVGLNGDGSSGSTDALGDRWFEVLQACGNYGGWGGCAARGRASCCSCRRRLCAGAMLVPRRCPASCQGLVAPSPRSA